MLELTGGSAITEINGVFTSSAIGDAYTIGSMPAEISGFWPCTQTVYWNSWPVYICTDRTKKAIEVLKHLESKKLIRVTSVKKFIELVERISNIL
jgi:hypothetical protein